MNRKPDGRRRRRLPLVLAVLALAALTVGSAFAASIPARQAAKSGVTVYQNAKAAVDASNAKQGYLSVTYTGGKTVRIKVQITKSGGATYTYDLNHDGTAEVFPLTEGDGTYQIKVFENTTGSRYAQAYSCKLDVKLDSPFAPFLYANQYVNFTDQSDAVATAATVVKNARTDLEKVTAVYHYVVEHIDYDYALAKNIPTGYLPDVDQVLKDGKGICFDYAAVTAAMLRSQGIPCKLVVGYAGKVYHAWVNVYIAGTGWVDGLVYFDGERWSLMDPTFVASGGDDPSVLKFVGEGKNYTQKYAY